MKLSKWEQDDLEAMIDNHGLQAVVEAVSVICQRKANQLRMGTMGSARHGWEVASNFFSKLRVPLTLN